MKKFIYFMVFASVIIQPSCTDYFGDETELDFIDPPEFDQREVAYVPIQPELNDFVRPVDIVAGFDELLYVVDETAEEIVAMDRSGRILGSKRIRGVTTVVQDRKLELLAIGKKDTSIQDVNYTLPCIYRIKLAAGGGRYGIQHAEIINEIVHPFYYKSGFSSSDVDVELTGLAVAEGNDYYVSRTGPKNNRESSVLPPDQSVLLFTSEDEYVTPVSILTSQGSFRTYFKEPSDITGLMMPPQIEVTPSRDFMTVLAAPGEPIQFRYITYNENPDGISYTPVVLQQDTTRAEGFITETNKFGTPSGITVTGDGTDYIFVTDSERDSVYQFTFQGFEGVRPPPGSEETKNIKVSFGGTGTSPTQFNNPQGVAYADRILYVADSDNGRVLRFKLTLDFD